MYGIKLKIHTHRAKRKGWGHSSAGLACRAPGLILRVWWCMPETPVSRAILSRATVSLKPT